ncbi:hypothetical protein [Micromonospora zhanjiangensis]|uniref:Uncharacterized protein n=1 Tax=Micromonospora zhanjiangensis TaxID=1522057 RepID=A0ABV8KNU0_9ACTN
MQPTDRPDTTAKTDRAGDDPGINLTELRMTDEARAAMYPTPPARPVESPADRMRHATSPAADLQELRTKLDRARRQRDDLAQELAQTRDALGRAGVQPCNTASTPELVDRLASRLDREATTARQTIADQAEQLRRNGTLIGKFREWWEFGNGLWSDHDTATRKHDPLCHDDERAHWCDCDCWCHEPADEPADVEELLTLAAENLDTAETDDERADAIGMLLSGWYAAWPPSAVTDPHDPIAAELVRLLRAPAAPAPDLPTALRSAFTADELDDLHSLVVDAGELHEDTPKEDPTGRLADALFLARTVEQDATAAGLGSPRRAQEPTDAALDTAHAQGWAAAIAALLDRDRYMTWWESVDVQPDGTAQQHLARYLAAVAPSTRPRCETCEEPIRPGEQVVPPLPGVGLVEHAAGACPEPAAADRQHPANDPANTQDDLTDRLAAALARLMRRNAGDGISPATWRGWEALLVEHGKRTREG